MLQNKTAELNNIIAAAVCTLPTERKLEMKTRLLPTILVVAGLVASTASAQTAFAEEINQDKLNQLPAQDGLSVTAAIIYNPDLTNTGLAIGAGIPGSTVSSNIGNSATWEYYRFCANPGDIVDIEVHRTTFDMDPAMQVCQGTTADSAGVFPFGGCGSAGPFIGWADDNNGIPHGVGGFFSDPKLTFNAPAGPTPNEFTLMVLDFIGAGPSPQFEIHVAGVSPCLIPVVIDIHPGSDPNSINLCSNGAVPVAILGSPDYNVDDIDPDTLSFAGAGVKVVGRKDPRTLCSFEDVNADGLDDLVCHFITTDLGALDGASMTATVAGNLFDGTPIQGADNVNVVKDTCF